MSCRRRRDHGSSRPPRAPSARPYGAVALTNVCLRDGLSQLNAVNSHFDGVNAMYSLRYVFEELKVGDSYVNGYADIEYSTDSSWSLRSLSCSAAASRATTTSGCISTATGSTAGTKPPARLSGCRRTSRSLASAVLKEVPDDDGRRAYDGQPRRLFFAAALPNGARCHLCGALVHRNSIQFDHDKPRRVGGSASLENAKVSHPYCNSIKDHLVKDDSIT